MTHFTNRYSEVTKLEGVPFSIAIKHEEPNRWICYSYKELLGKDKYQFTLIDNHLESFSFIWSGPGTTTFITFNGDCIDKNLSIVYTDIYRNLPPEYIICRTSNHSILPIPDFLIDVLQTVQSNVLFEVVRRSVVSFHRKMGLIKQNESV